MLFNDNDHQNVSAAIMAAEARTSGEIVAIVSSEKCRYPATALTIAAVLALALPMLVLLTGWSPAGLFAGWDEAAAAPVERHGIEALMVAQALLFVAALGLVYTTELGRLLTPYGLRQDRVHRAALTQFKARGFEATSGRTGVLIYIDEPERIAEIIADTGIYAKVPADHWATVITTLIGGIKAGTPATGLVAAIGLAADVLATHFPRRDDDVNELPDHLIEI